MSQQRKAPPPVDPDALELISAELDEEDDQFEVDDGGFEDEITVAAEAGSGEDDFSEAFSAFDRPDQQETSRTRIMPMSAEYRRALQLGISMAGALIEPLPPSPQAVLEFADGRLVPVTQSLVILGRGKGVADVLLDNDDQVSRQHAALIFASGQFVLEDLESTNGVFVDDERIKRVQLEPGAKVRIGGFEFRLRWD